MLLDQLMFQQTYPRGTTERKKVDGEWEDVDIDPLYQNQEARRGARSQASLGEDEMLRRQLGSSRKRNLGEPTGMYSGIDYAGGPSPEMTAKGVTRGYRYTMPGEVMSIEDKTKLLEHGKDWYDQQMKLWGRRTADGPRSYDQMRMSVRNELRRR